MEAFSIRSGGVYETWGDSVLGDMKRLTDNNIVLEPIMLSLALLDGLTHFFEWYSRALY